MLECVLICCASDRECAPAAAGGVEGREVGQAAGTGRVERGNVER